MESKIQQAAARLAMLEDSADRLLAAALEEVEERIATLERDGVRVDEELLRYVQKDPEWKH